MDPGDEDDGESRRMCAVLIESRDWAIIKNAASHAFNELLRKVPACKITQAERDALATLDKWRPGTRPQ